MNKTDTVHDPKKVMAELLSQVNPPQLLLVTSNDQLRRGRALVELTSKFFSENAITVTKINAANWSRESKMAIINELNSPSLFNPQSLVVITNVDVLTKGAELEDVLECVKHASEHTCLWLSSANLGKTNKLRKAFEKTGKILEFAELKGIHLKNWIKKEARQLGISDLSEQLIEAIKHVSGEQPDQITSILRHVSLYSDDGNLSYADFYKLYPDAPEESEFALLDLIHFGKSGQVEFKISKFFLDGKNSFMFLGLLVRTYSKFLAMRSLLDSGISLVQAREELGMKEWTFKKYLEVVKSKSFTRLYSDLESLLKADSRLKNKSLSETDIFCELAQKIAVN